MGNLVKEQLKKGQEDMKKLVEPKFAPIGTRGFIKGRGSGFSYQEWARGSVADFMAQSNLYRGVPGCRQ